MTNHYTPTVLDNFKTYITQLVMDCDPLAERWRLYDEMSGSLISCGDLAKSNVISLPLSIKYSLGTKCQLVIVDTNEEYNASILSGITGVAVDSNVKFL